MYGNKFRQFKTKYYSFSLFSLLSFSNSFDIRCIVYVSSMAPTRSMTTHLPYVTLTNVMYADGCSFRKPDIIEYRSSTIRSPETTNNNSAMCIMLRSRLVVMFVPVYVCLSCIEEKPIAPTRHVRDAMSC